LILNTLEIHFSGYFDFILLRSKFFIEISLLLYLNTNNSIGTNNSRIEAMKRKTEIITKLIRKKVSEIDPQAQVILFGSRARGDERIDSDWDVLILTEYSIDIEKENQFRNHLYDIELETGEPISLFAYSKADWNTKQRISPFYANVRKEGISL
jgi:uncharacterized protein